jgi:hypothetical protein
MDGIQELSYASEGTGYFIEKGNKGLVKTEVSGKKWMFQKAWQDLDAGTTELKDWLQQEFIDLTATEEDTIFAHKKIDNSREFYFRIATQTDGYSCELIEKTTLSYGTPILLSRENTGGANF